MHIAIRSLCIVGILCFHCGAFVFLRYGQSIGMPFLGSQAAIIGVWIAIGRQDIRLRIAVLFSSCFWLDLSIENVLSSFPWLAGGIGMLVGLTGAIASVIQYWTVRTENTWQYSVYDLLTFLSMVCIWIFFWGNDALDMFMSVDHIYYIEVVTYGLAMTSLCSISCYCVAVVTIYRNACIARIALHSAIIYALVAFLSIVLLGIGNTCNIVLLNAFTCIIVYVSVLMIVITFGGPKENEVKWH